MGLDAPCRSNIYNVAMALAEQLGGERLAAIRRLQLLTILWMSVEVTVSALAAARAHSIAVLAFGGDSAIELLSAVIVLTRFSGSRLSEKMSEAGGQRGGLSGSRAGQNKHRSLGREDGLALRRVQALQVRRLGTQCRRFRHFPRGRAGRTDRQPNGGIEKGSNGCSRYPRYPQASHLIFRFPDSGARCMVLG